MRRITSIRRATSRPRREGSLLIEFALVALVLYLLLAAIITFGYLLYAAQSLQTTVDLAAREISRTPLPPANPALNLHAVLNSGATEVPGVDLTEFRRTVYDKHYLVLSLDEIETSEQMSALISRLPLVNQQLVNVMIRDQINGQPVLRYPGAVYLDNDESDDPNYEFSDPLYPPMPSGYLVAIPLVDTASYDANDAVIQITWVEVVEPIIDPETLTDPMDDPFLVTSDEHGVVALRINYPFQSAAMSGFRRQPPILEPYDPNPPNLSRPILSYENNDIDNPNLIIPTNPEVVTGPLVRSDYPDGAYSGMYGLGRQGALAKPVRPFRRVLSVQAIYRREVFN